MTRPPGASEWVRVISVSLRATREARGLSRAAAARITGISARRIESWERGDRSIFVDDLGAYLQALGVIHLRHERPRENPLHEGEVARTPNLDDYDNGSH